VQLAAPGESLSTTDIGPLYSHGNQGTSYAAPHVSATAALIRSLAPSWGYAEIRPYLVDSTHKPACPRDPAALPFSLCGKSQSGGILDVDAATGSPIKLEEPQAGTVWTKRTLQTVSWSAWSATFPGTTNPCPELTVFYSANDGKTWSKKATTPATLLAPSGSTRSGSAQIRAPARATQKARIAVRCSGTRLERWSDPFTVQ
jgi:subtilisin family serine protease